MGAIRWRGEGSEMRSLLAVAAILAMTIDLSDQALTVPRMRKRELPSLWQENLDLEAQPDSFDMLEGVFDKEPYDYKWDRYEDSLTDKLNDFTYQKRTKEWYTRLG